MYAIVDIAGQQFKIEKDVKIFVHRLEGQEGALVEFDKVLLVENEGKVMVGVPNVADATVKAKILSHVKGDKVLVFKKKRRKSYQKMNGHRQYMSQIQIEDIVVGSVKASDKAATPKVKAAKVEAPVAEAAPKKSRKKASEE